MEITNSEKRNSNIATTKKIKYSHEVVFQTIQQSKTFVKLKWKKTFFRFNSHGMKCKANALHYCSISSKNNLYYVV